MAANLVDPPKSFTPEQAQQWFKLQRMLLDNLTNTGFSNILFVDQVDGNDASAQRGSLTFKFATIQAALDAAQVGDLIWVSPGMYNEDLTWPDTNNVTLMGSDQYSTAIRAATPAVDTLTIRPTMSVQLASVRDLLLLPNGGNSLVVDGSADTDMFDPIRIDNVSSLGDVSLSVVNNFRITNLVMGDADIRFMNCGGGVVLDSDFDLFAVTYQLAPPVAPDSGVVAIAVSTSLCNVLNCQGIPYVVFGKDTQAIYVTASILDNATRSGFVQVNGKIPGFDIAGIVRSIDITFNLENGDGEVCRFDFAEIGGRVTIGSDGSTDRGRANIRNAMLYDQDGPHTVGALTDLDLRESAFSQESLIVAASGTVDRTRWIQTILAGNSNTPVAWANASNPVPYPAGRIPDHVTHECALVAEMPIAISDKSATQVEYTKGGADVVDVVVCAFRQYAG